MPQSRTFSPIQLTKEGLARESDLNLLEQQFSLNHALYLRQLLDPDLMRMILARVPLGVWASYAHGQIGREFLLDSASVLALLNFAVNTPEFLRVIERITRCGPFSRFDGRVYRMAPRTDHYDTWHNDVCNNRLIGMSINLGDRPYSGGVFQLRRKGCQEIIAELPNLIQGDAILFRISREFEHRITPMEGTEPKTAFAGWFRSGGNDFFSELRQRTTTETLET